MLVVFPGDGRLSVPRLAPARRRRARGRGHAARLSRPRDAADRAAAVRLGHREPGVVPASRIPIGDNLARLRYAVFPLLLLLAVRRRRRGLAAIVAAAALVYAAAPDLIQVGGQADASSSHARRMGAGRLVPPHAPAGRRARRGRADLGALGVVLPALARDPARARLVPPDRHGAQRPALPPTGSPAPATTPGSAHGRAVRAADAVSARRPRRARPRRACCGRGARACAVVWRHAGFTIYTARHRARLMTGAAGVRVIDLQPRPDRRHSRADAGTEALRVSYSPYWVAAGAASCVVRGRNGMSHGAASPAVVPSRSR